jgi:hypothetical protein
MHGGTSSAKRTTAAAAVLLVLLAASACAAAVSEEHRPVTAIRVATQEPAEVPSFGKAVVVVFENKGPGQVLGNPAAPTFTSLAHRYAALANYTAVAHPSLPDYLALVSGSTQGMRSDCTRCSIAGRSLADTLRAGGKSWKSYEEGLPYPGFSGARAGRYTKVIDPFLYFRDVVSSPGAHVVPLAQFRADLGARRLPDFSLVVPNLCHDMHNCSVATGDAWLERFLRPLLASSELRNGVVFIVFDEGRPHDRTGGGGRVPALVVGRLVRPRSSSSAPLDHYSVLRTIEQAWHLPLLGRSARAHAVTGIWRHEPLHPGSAGALGRYLRRLRGL